MITQKEFLEQNPVTSSGQKASFIRSRMTANGWEPFQVISALDKLYEDHKFAGTTPTELEIEIATKESQI